MFDLSSFSVSTHDYYVKPHLDAIENGLFEEELDFLIKMLYEYPFVDGEYIKKLTYPVEHFEKFLDRKDFEEMGNIYNDLEKVNYSFTFNDDFKINRLRVQAGLKPVPNI